MSPIVPSGNHRKMVSQNFFNNPDLDKTPSIDSVPREYGDINSGDNFQSKNDISSPGNYEEKRERSLTTYIYNKLKGFGYPGRRLQEFKSEFVKETVSADGIQNVDVVIPDKKYPDASGNSEMIEANDLKSISKEMKDLFGLNFNGAERSKGKWTIKFTSVENTDVDGEEDIVSDNLEDVYGNPNFGKKKASSYWDGGPGESINELIEKSKEDFFNKFFNGDNSDAS